MKKIFISALFCLPAPCLAGGTSGATPFDSLQLDLSARAAAMGGACAALPGGPETLGYNPAGLGAAKRNSAAFSYRGQFGDVTQEYAGVMLRPGYVNGVSGGLALTLDTIGMGNISRTTLSNPAGTGLGTFDIRDWYIAAGYGQKVGEGLFLGISAKYLRETIGGTAGSAGAIDMGVIGDLGNYGLPLSAGIAVQNLGTRVKFQSEGEELPLNFKAGLAYKLPGDKAALAADLDRVRYGGTTFHAGFELKVLEEAVFRLGYNGSNEAGSGLVFGAGWEEKGFLLDYAFEPYGDLGDSNIITVGLFW